MYRDRRMFVYTCCMSENPPNIDHGTFPTLKSTPTPALEPPTLQPGQRRIKLQVVHHTTSILSLLICSFKTATF